MRSMAKITDMIATPITDPNATDNVSMRPYVRHNLIHQHIIFTSMGWYKLPVIICP